MVFEDSKSHLNIFTIKGGLPWIVIMFPEDSLHFGASKVAEKGDIALLKTAVPLMVTQGFDTTQHK